VKREHHSGLGASQEAERLSYQPALEFAKVALGTPTSQERVKCATTDRLPASNYIK